MAATEDSNDTLWNQSVCSKSWVELVEEEEERLSQTNGSTISFNSPLLRDSTNTKHATENRMPIKEEPLEDESACDISLATDTKDIKILPSDVLPNFSVSHIKSIASNDSIKENNSKSKSNEPQKDFLQEDLSLTSHLNGFQLVSPCKVDRKTPTKTPVKTSVGHYLSQNDRSERGSSPSQLTKRKLQPDEPKSGVTDEMLMPSPSKIRRQNTPKQEPRTPKRNTPNYNKFTPNNRKRSRELTPGHSSEKKTPRDLETDPEVLARRQKQIDYGKNTVGYDRYRQLVPKESRSRMHPRTPPLHLKFSRRAWDGLIKVWRQRLHFWDPPSEGGGNPECLEAGSDMSDASSTDGSLPNTPVQDKKRQCWKRNHHKSLNGSCMEEDDDNQGCTPLPPEE